MTHVDGASRRASGLVAAAAIACVSCAPRITVSLPGGTANPNPSAIEIFADATAHCRTVRTWSAEMAVSGRARGRTIRLRTLGGTTADGDLRLEGVAPFGAPLFVLAVRDEVATLVLPRERRVLREEPSAEVLEALVGLRLSAADLHAVLTGCVVAQADVQNGRGYDEHTLAVDVGDRRTVYLQRLEGVWRVSAARLESLLVGYDQFAGAAPTEVRLVTGGAGEAQVALSLRLSQIEENATLPPEAFAVADPDDARPLSLDELRERGVGTSGTT
jgi:hypothetical protein